MIKFGVRYFRTKLTPGEPKFWTYMALLQLMIAVAGWVADQGLGLMGGGLGVITALAYRRVLADPEVVLGQILQDTIVESQNCPDN